MKILTVCSSLDFINFTRRATIEAIHDLNPGLDILLFNSVLNIFRKKNILPGIRFMYYHFWIVEKIRKFKIPVYLEHLLRGYKWKRIFNRYEIIFFIDPNQYYLLPYVGKSVRLIYLLRDPSVLQNPANKKPESMIIERADLILGVSENLCRIYFRKHYGFQPDNVLFWSNAVDMRLWDHNKYKSFHKNKPYPVAGMAGNITRRTDLDLLYFLVSSCPDVRFEIAGKLNLDEKNLIKWQNIISFENFYYHGFISFNEIPEVVASWDIGLLLESAHDEYSMYYNQNKIYQYLSLGKTFVSYRYNDHFATFEDMAFLAESHHEYANFIYEAFARSQQPETLTKAINLAKMFSAEKKAEEFITISKQLVKT